MIDDDVPGQWKLDEESDAFKAMAGKSESKCGRGCPFWVAGMSSGFRWDETTIEINATEMRYNEDGLQLAVSSFATSTTMTSQEALYSSTADDTRSSSSGGCHSRWKLCVDVSCRKRVIKMR